jgi:hypothetical protein
MTSAAAQSGGLTEQFEVTRVRLMTGVVLWTACGAVPCLHKALEAQFTPAVGQDGQRTFRTSLPKGSDVELPPGASSRCASWPPRSVRTPCDHRHNRLKYACVNFRRLGLTDFRMFARPACPAAWFWRSACPCRTGSAPGSRHDNRAEASGRPDHSEPREKASDADQRRRRRSLRGTGCERIGTRRCHGNPGAAMPRLGRWSPARLDPNRACWSRRLQR